MLSTRNELSSFDQNSVIQMENFLSLSSLHTGVPAGNLCNTTNNHCVDNAQCSTSDSNPATCQCESSHYANDDKICVPSELDL